MSEAPSRAEPLKYVKMEVKLISGISGGEGGGRIWKKITLLLNYYKKNYIGED